ncbi:YitT family protein [Ureaplasma canigenitalium]|uniref:YitT family protein n=1 Tax=Ureaplasma canigenitalium TaxID=42092 RepID=UPI00068B131F|nr:YitT family protein [Ureaplasma canigenitalium]
MEENHTEQKDNGLGIIRPKKQETIVLTEKIKFKAGILKFANFYATKNIALTYLIVIGFSLFTGLIGLVFVQNTGIYSPGITGLSQGVARLTQTLLIQAGYSAQVSKTTYDVLFWLLVILINVPLVIFSYFKIGKHFALLTLVFLIGSQIFGLILALIPGSDHINIFGDNRITYPDIDNFFTNNILNTVVKKDTLNFDSIADENIKTTFLEFVDKNPDAKVLDLFRIANNHNEAYQNALYELAKPLYKYHQLIVNKVQILPWTDSDQATKIPSLFVYSIVFSIFDGIFISVVYIVGGSSGGTDVASFYYSKKYGKPIGSILTYFNVATLILGIILGSFIPAGLSDHKFFDAQLFFSPNFVASILSSIILGVVLNIYFPQNKTLKVQLYTTKLNEVIENLRNHDYNNSITISTSGQSCALKTTSLETISPYVEFPSLLRLIREVDPDGLLIIYPILQIDGTMVVRKSKLA